MIVRKPLPDGSAEQTVGYTMIIRALLFSFTLVLSSFANSNAASDLDAQLPISPDLRHALDLWLADDDAAALPALSKLALAGDRAAQLFLALVERTRLGPSPYLEGLSRDALHNIFRPPLGDSRFRINWIDHLARTGDPLAIVLRDSRLPDPNREATTALLKAGEGPAAMNGVRYLSLYGTDADRAFLMEGKYALHGMRAFVLGQQMAGRDKSQGLEVLREMTRYGNERDVTNDDADAAALATYMTYGYPYGAATKDNPWREEIKAWLETAVPAQPIASFCRAHCQSSFSECGTAVLGLIGGYYVAIRLASPLEAVIPNATYATSPRAEATILRRMAALESEKGGEPLATIEEIAKQNRCVASLVSAQRDSRATD